MDKWKMQYPLLTHMSIQLDAITLADREAVDSERAVD